MSAQQAFALSVDNVRFGSYPDKTRLVFDLSGDSAFRVFALQEPYRLVIDLPSFEWKADKVDHPPATKVNAVRHGELQPGISRIVFDMEQPIAVKTAFTLPKQEEKPNRLVIDYSGTTTAGFEKERGRVLGAASLNDILKAHPFKEQRETLQEYQTASVSGMAPPPAPKPDMKKKPARKPLIVIDPGHGGVDPGAIGTNKVYEKHVVLALGKELERQLEASGKYRVIMTRTKDTFIKLGDRVKFARDHGADLFVSIHADSIEKKNVRGASFYTLSEKASDKQTARLAARENQADLIAGIDLSHEDKDVANILVDLAIRDTTNQGKFFANKVVDSFRSNGLRILENPHRHAGFAVLKAPDIPSILVEAGFMSNKKEAQMLNTQSYRAKVAKALKSGIDTYFKQVEKNQR
ncbi:MAG: N-acetylmuramoyl-L-alanine amidase [Pseudomonadota bacterium]